MTSRAPMYLYRQYNGFKIDVGLQFRNILEIEFENGDDVFEPAITRG